MNSRSHVGFWLAVFVLIFFISPVFRSGEGLEQAAVNELEMTRETFGGRVGDWLDEHASFVFRLSERMGPTGMLQQTQLSSKQLALTKKVAAGPGLGAAVAFNSYLKALVLNTYVMILRALVVTVWMLVLLPLLIAALVDGFAQRAIKRSEFGTIRPAAFAMGSLIVVPLGMAPVVYLIWPFEVPPSLAPIWAAVMTLPLAWTVSNMQPIFGKR